MTGTALALLRRLLLLAAALLLVPASPAGADAAGPSDFRSEVTEVAPAVEGLSARIRGGDSFLELQVAPGLEVVVEGYNGEPYLRFGADGAVERNRWSSATYINDDRKGAGTIPDKAQDATTPPEWEEIATGGSFAWHDHRIHWMSEVSPRVERGQPVGGAYDPWVVPLEVDGRTVEVRGTLIYETTPSPLPWVLAAVGGLAVVVGLGRRAPVAIAAMALLGTAALAFVVGRSEFAATPDNGANPLLWMLPAVAAVTSAGAVAWRRKPSAVVFTLASVATISGWALLRINVLTKPVLPTELPFHLDRATTAGSLAVAAACAYLAISSGALKLPELADDEDRPDDPHDQ